MKRWKIQSIFNDFLSGIYLYFFFDIDKSEIICKIQQFDDDWKLNQAISFIESMRRRKMRVPLKDVLWRRSNLNF